MTIIIDGTNGISGVDGTAALPAIEGTDSNTGLFYPAADTVAVSTGGSERMRVDSSGNMLVGTTTQATGAKLTVNGSIQGTITSGTTVASTSGTSIDFTSIPSWVKRITVMFNQVSTNGATNFLAQIGAGSFLTSGYVSANAYTGASAGGTTSTAGYILTTAPGAANNQCGHLVITLVGSNVWVASCVLARQDGYTNMGGGSVTLSGTLDRVRITTVNGTDVFDAGSINILYEG